MNIDFRQLGERRMTTPDRDRQDQKRRAAMARRTRWQGLRPTGQSLPDGTPIPGKPIIVTCPPAHKAAGLCTKCVDEFALVLADVPMLIDDLDVAISGQAEFLERGYAPADPVDGGEVAERLGIPRAHWSFAEVQRNPATSALSRLTQALEGAGNWFDARRPEQLADDLRRSLPELADEPALRRIAVDVSSAASRAHRVIDGPPDLWFYGPCPDCGRDIWQERIHEADESTPVQCRFPSCGYAQPVPEHNRRQLVAADDRWMTVTELVSAFEASGEPITRHQLNGWIRREGLPREPRPLVRWQDGKLERTGEVWTYRVGDVREMALKAQIRAEQRRGYVVGAPVPTLQTRVIQR